MIVTWEVLSIAGSMVMAGTGLIIKINRVENDYQTGKMKLKDVETQLIQCSKNIEIQKKETARLKAQISKEFNNIAWQLRIIIGSLKDIENFLEKSSGYTRRKMSEEEDTRGFMLKKIKELDSPDEQD
ncbi:hypothetical protein [Laspinema olomoucense]|uniref:hypothetical protein n=1 Tax=Laspinema olomoucense TaxID=3231600 RepID=UPI0021BBAA0B|nr:hypothetical protein [Laspinema sp. D3a]MCT7987616.1 hypothetical protein [Laspinema sp. D3a]